MYKQRGAYVRNRTDVLNNMSGIGIGSITIHFHNNNKETRITIKMLTRLSDEYNVSKSG